MATRTTPTRVTRAPRPPRTRKASPDFFGPDEVPEGEAVAALDNKVGSAPTPKRRAGPRRGRPGRPITIRMPVMAADGTVFRPRAPGSRGTQPPVELGPLTGQLKLAAAVSTLPYNDITSALGKLIRQYRAHLAAAEQIWQQLETLERGLRELADEDGEGV